jgi:hypothetical protein
MAIDRTSGKPRSDHERRRRRWEEAKDQDQKRWKNEDKSKQGGQRAANPRDFAALSMPKYFSQGVSHLVVSKIFFQCLFANPYPKRGDITFWNAFRHTHPQAFLNKRKFPVGVYRSGI